MKILITGGSGFLGRNISSILKSRYQVFSAFHSNPQNIAGCKTVKVDLRCEQEVESLIERIEPDIIIHAAAVSSPDICEKEKQAAWDINTGGSMNILRAAKKAGNPRIVYISTDMVFNGAKGFYTEKEIPVASNYYAMTKLESENILLDKYENTLVLRISLQYGWAPEGSTSFTDWLYSNLKNATPSPLFTDQFRTPLYVKDTAIAIEEAGIKSSAKGLYHLGGNQRLDRYSFAFIFATLFDFPKTLLVKSSLKDVTHNAPRPEDVSLDSSLFYRTFNFKPRSINEAFQDMYQTKP